MCIYYYKTEMKTPSNSNFFETQDQSELLGFGTVVLMSWVQDVITSEM